MPNSLSLKSLIRLQRRQFTVGQKRTALVGPVILVAYLWVIEFLLIFLLREKAESLPSLFVSAFFVGILVMDFMCKVILVRDHSVMDPFLKTRPVSQKQWNRFLAVSQFWSLNNLIVPAAVFPLCLLLVRFPLGLAVWVAFYLLSVLGGFLVMLMKRRGPYAPEKAVSTTARRAKLGRAGYAVFSLQSKSLLRSKRIRTSILIMVVLSLIEVLLMISENTRVDNIWLFIFISYAAMALPQYGFGIEASCFAGLWTRPVSVKQLLVNKFWLSVALAGIALLIIVPIFLFFKKDILLPVSYALFSAGFGSPLLLIDAYKATPFDLFGKTFFNYQGAGGMYRVGSILGSLFLIILGVCLPLLLPGWPSVLILSGLGLLGFIFHRPYFAWVERKFLRDKYRYLDIYQSR